MASSTKKVCNKLHKYYFGKQHFKDTVTTELAFKVNTNITKVTIGHYPSGSKGDELWKYVDSKPEFQKEASDVIYEAFKKAIQIVEVSL